MSLIDYSPQPIDAMTTEELQIEVNFLRMEYMRLVHQTKDNAKAIRLLLRNNMVEDGQNAVAIRVKHHLKNIATTTNKERNNQ